MITLLACVKAGLCDGNRSQNATRTQKVRMMKFAGQRNRSHFKLLKDPKLRKYFAPDFVWDVRVFNNRQEFLRMVNLLRKTNPDVVIGSYASGFYALDQTKEYYPPAKLPLSECSKDWFLRNRNKTIIKAGKDKDRYWLDMRLAEVREAVVSTAVSRAKSNGLDAVCFDNCYWGISPANAFPAISAEEWTDAYMKFYKLAGEQAHKEGLKCIVNAVTYASTIPDAFRAVEPYVDGIMTEMAFHPRVRTPELLLRELQAYEYVLKKGKIVLVVPRYAEDEAFALLAIRPLGRKYNKIYLSVAGAVHDEPLYRLADIEWNIAKD
jgi:hypothetical protein